MKPARILLADDHPMTLEGIRAFLEPHFLSVGTVTDGRALVEAALSLKPDLIVLDITMPLLNGIEAATRIHKNLPRTKLLFVTMHSDPAYLEAALTAGATGYVLKSAARSELLDACAAVLKGQIYVSPGLSTEPLARFKDPLKATAARHLSPREREVLQLVAEGKATRAMAAILNISVKTVAFHRENIKRKLGLKSTAELTRYAMEHGIV